MVLLVLCTALPRFLLHASCSTCPFSTAAESRAGVCKGALGSSQHGPAGMGFVHEGAAQTLAAASPTECSLCPPCVWRLAVVCLLPICVFMTEPAAVRDLEWIRMTRDMVFINKEIILPTLRIHALSKGLNARQIWGWAVQTPLFPWQTWL